MANALDKMKNIFNDLLTENAAKVISRTDNSKVDTSNAQSTKHLISTHFPICPIYILYYC